MAIELRFYNKRYNMDEEYYTGDDDVYLTLYYPNPQALIDDWHNLFKQEFADHWLEGETYSAWDEDGNILCGGAFDPGDIDIITENMIGE